MKTLLRHIRTGLYLQGPEKWTENPDLACDFRFTDRALQYAAVWELQEVELAFVFGDSLVVTTAPLEQAALHYAAA